jgi:hypothetical protein
MGIGDLFRMGKTRFIVTRLFVHLSGSGATPLLGVLNRAARDAIAADGDLDTLGEGLATLCQSLLQYRDFWKSAANEGDEYWDEGEASTAIEDLFTDSAQRYLSELPPGSSPPTDDDLLTLPPTDNLVVMLTVAYEGEVPDLETNLADLEALEYGLKALISLHYNQKLRAIQVHFSPAQLGDELTDDQLLQNFPELIPL